MTARRVGWLVLSLYAICIGLSIWGIYSLPTANHPVGPRLLSQDGSIAVVELQGPISLSADGFGGDNIDSILRDLKELKDRPDVRAVILRINSPGGSVAAVQELHQAVLALRTAGKFVVSSFGDVAASGGYYVAAASDKIVANPGTLTGSIGVILQLGNVQELFRKFGVEVETIKSGSMKDAGSPFRPLTAEERRLFQSIVSDAYNQFFRAVAEGRGLAENKLRPLADGRIFTGAQAKEVGLIDVLGGFETAVETARQLSGIRSERPTIFYTTRPWGRLARWLGSSLAAPRLPFQSAAKRVRFEYVWE